MLYNGDFDDTFVMLENTSARFTIANMLKPYIKNGKENLNPAGGNLWPSDGVWTCPSVRVDGGSNTHFTVSYNWLYLTKVDPTWNFVPQWGATTTWGIWAWTEGGRSASEVATPADTILFAESTRTDGPRGTQPTWSGLMTPLARQRNGVNGWFAIHSGRHSGVGSVAWVDGHVSAKKPEQISGSFNASGVYTPALTPPDKYYDLLDN